MIVTNRFFESLLDTPRANTPRSYLAEKDGVYTLEVELPGVKKEDISVNVESNLLKIAATRKRAEEEVKYEREFRISNEMDSSNIKAMNENGILTLTLLRKPKEAGSQIQVM